MPEVSTYDPKKVTVSVGGRVITGFAADGVVTLTHNEDAVTPSVGAKGDVAYSENANNSGNAALPLMSTSSSRVPARDLREAASRPLLRFGRQRRRRHPGQRGELPHPQDAGHPQKQRPHHRHRQRLHPRPQLPLRRGFRWQRRTGRKGRNHYQKGATESIWLVRKR